MNMDSLNTISIQGFKSIRNLENFKLENLNVLIGPKGAGKSNFIEFFRMLRAMSAGGLEEYFNRNGGSDSFFFDSPKETSQIFAEMRFGMNGFRFSIEPTASSSAIVTKQATYFPREDAGNCQEHGGGRPEADLAEWDGDKSDLHGSSYLSVTGHIYQAISRWMVYHFHDTGTTAPMRRDQPVHDIRELQPDASNIAPLLLWLSTQHPFHYRRIVETIQLIAPFFADFLLVPEKRGAGEVVRLQWKQKGSSFPYQPWQLSDGTIRLICLTTALLQPHTPSTIVIDEPELGLHPVALDVIAALIHETSQRTQLVISTQSSTFSDRFAPEDIIVVDRRAGASTFRRLDPQQLESWLDDYTLGSLVRDNIIEAGPQYA